MPYSRSVSTQLRNRGAAFRHIWRYRLTQFVLLAVAGSSALTAANPNLTLRVWNEAVRTGGWAQIKVYADAPALIAGGVLGLDLDPKVFGPIASVSTFSANGDAIGMARVSGTHVEASFTSLSGGIGQLPEVPVFVVRAPVLADAGLTSGFISLSLPQTPPAYPLPGNQPYPEGAWVDPAGNRYLVTLVSGRAFSGQLFSIQNVTPATGLHPAGTVLHIDGSGFDSSTRVTAEGLAITSVQFVSSNRMDVTTAGSRELTGVRFRVSNDNGQSGTDFFAAPDSALTPLGSTNVNLENLHAILPLQERRATVASGPGATAVLLLNTSDNPVDVLVRSVGLSVGRSGQTVTLPPGALRYILKQGSTVDSTYIDAASPVRFAKYFSNNSGQGITRADPGAFGPPPLQASVSPLDIVVDYQTGTPSPTPRPVGISYDPNSIQDVTVQVNARPWLKVTRTDSRFPQLTLAFDTTGLSPGTYSGTIVVTPVVPASLVGFTASASTVHITLNVSTQPTIAVVQNYANLPSGITRFDPISFDVSTNGSPAAFSITAATDSGDNWLSTDITSGTTPATVNIKANPGNLPGGFYSGTLTVKGPVNTVDMRVALSIYPLATPQVQANPGSIIFVREAGLSGPFGGALLTFSPVSSPFNIKVTTDDGADWLKVLNFAIPQNPTASADVNVDASSLAPGTYRGTITGSSSTGTVQVPVTLTVVARPKSPLVVTPTSLSFTTAAGVDSPAQILSVSSPDGPVLFTIEQAPLQVHVASLNSPVSSSTITGTLAPSQLSVTAGSTVPGSYQGNIVLSTSAGKVTIPVSINIIASAAYPPLLASVVNAASQTAGPLAPGEIISVRGIGVGPASLPSDDARVLINGIVATPTYGSPDQWNVTVPTEVDGATTASLQVFSGGAASEKWVLPVATTAPGVFTIGSTGVGRGAVLNQDNTINEPSNPAPGGTIVQIFATGGGVPGRTLPVKVMFGGNEAPVVFAGQAPSLVPGVLQINAVVPKIPFGLSELPVFLVIDGVTSPLGVTIAVR